MRYSRSLARVMPTYRRSRSELAGFPFLFRQLPGRICHTRDCQLVVLVILRLGGKSVLQFLCPVNGTLKGNVHGAAVRSISCVEARNGKPQGVSVGARG